jgi:drug/metabolite transporter (DMT)-like permease
MSEILAVVLDYLFRFDTFLSAISLTGLALAILFPNRKGIGCALGLSAQFAWAYYSISLEQWGLFPNIIGHFIVFVVGLYGAIVNRKKDLNDSQE